MLYKTYQSVRQAVCVRNFSQSTILARTASVDLVGRSVDVARILDHASGKSTSNGLMLLSAPSAETSELLRQAYDQLFVKDQDLIPFYFEIKASDVSTENTARRFLSEWVVQPIVEPHHGDPDFNARLALYRQLAELPIPEIAIMAGSVADRAAKKGPGSN